MIEIIQERIITKDNSVSQIPREVHEFMKKNLGLIIANEQSGKKDLFLFLDPSKMPISAALAGAIQQRTFSCVESNELVEVLLYNCQHAWVAHAIGSNNSIEHKIDLELI